MSVNNFLASPNFVSHTLSHSQGRWRRCMHY